MFFISVLIECNFVFRIYKTVHNRSHLMYHMGSHVVSNMDSHVTQGHHRVEEFHQVFVVMEW